VPIHGMPHGNAISFWESARENLRLERRIVPNPEANIARQKKWCKRNSAKEIRPPQQERKWSGVVQYQFTVRVVEAVCVVALASVPTPVIVIV